ncbi:MAG: helix-turn-helix domain-containing protein, partial [Polyangiales bacterium]
VVVFAEGDNAEQAAAAGAPADGGTGDPTPSLDAIRRRAADEERQQLVAALEATGGNVAAAARRMGLSRYQALRRLKKHGLK